MNVEKEEGERMAADEEDKIKIAYATEYADFRTKRRLMETINLGKINASTWDD